MYMCILPTILKKRVFITRLYGSLFLNVQAEHLLQERMQNQEKHSLKIIIKRVDEGNEDWDPDILRLN